jgi:hypothetical protein
MAIGVTVPSAETSKKRHNVIKFAVVSNKINERLIGDVEEFGSAKRYLDKEYKKSAVCLRRHLIILSSIRGVKWT